MLDSADAKTTYADFKVSFSNHDVDVQSLLHALQDSLAFFCLELAAQAKSCQLQCVRLQESRTTNPHSGSAFLWWNVMAAAFFSTVEPVVRTS